LFKRIADFNWVKHNSHVQANILLVNSLTYMFFCSKQTSKTFSIFIASRSSRFSCSDLRRCSFSFDIFPVPCGGNPVSHNSEQFYWT